MKKFCFYTLITIALLVPLVHFVAQAAPTTEEDFFSDNNYQLLQPLPDAAGSDVKVQAVDVTNLPGYINTMFLIVIGLGAVLAVLYISYGGIIYMSTDAVTGKKEGKEKIKQALWGLLIIIGCFFILQTINPTILNLTTLGGDSVQTRTVKATDPNNVGKWCIQVILDGKPFATDCDTQETCNARVLKWSQKRFTSTTCYVSSATQLQQRKMCTDISIEGKDYKSGTNADCTAGYAYSENLVSKGVCNEKQNWYLGKGFLIAKSCYEKNNTWCIDVSKKDGTSTGAPDCTTPGEAYSKNMTAVDLCEAKRSKFWNVSDPFTISPCQLQK